MNTEETIRESAYRLFSSKGMSCSTAAITKDAGVSQGILFHYYPTKEDLIVDLYVEALTACYEDAFVAFSEKPIGIDEYVAVLRRSWLHQLDWCLGHWTEFCYIQMFEGSGYLAALRSRDDERALRVESFIAQGIGLGVEIGAVRPFETGYLIDVGNAVTASTVRYLHDNPRKRRDEAFMEQAWRIYWLPKSA